MKKFIEIRRGYETYSVGGFKLTTIVKRVMHSDHPDYPIGSVVSIFDDMLEAKKQGYSVVTSNVVQEQLEQK